ncbi:hypothetical protein RFI_34393, partial [Reticulomyxa filosa]
MYQLKVVEKFKENKLDGKTFISAISVMEDITGLGISKIAAAKIFNAYCETCSTKIQKSIEKNGQNWSYSISNLDFVCYVTGGPTTKQITVKKTMTVEHIRMMINDKLGLTNDTYTLTGHGIALADSGVTYTFILFLVVYLSFFKTLEKYGIVESTTFSYVMKTYGGAS